MIAKPIYLTNHKYGRVYCYWGLRVCPNDTKKHLLQQGLFDNYCSSKCYMPYKL